MKNNIALIGFMGAGKSTAGKVLAGKLKMDFIELDSLVEQKAGKSISDIFRNDGEPAFRRLESQAAHEAAQSEMTVISCGGGVILDPANIVCLKKNALIIYLKAGPDVILKRVTGSAAVRPLLASDDPALAVSDLLAARCQLYEQSADMVIDTSSLNVDEVVSKIISELPAYESVNIQK
jgi:shikimate kinase